MSTGIKMSGGGRHKIRGSIDTYGSDDVAMDLGDSVDNDIDMKISLRDSKEKFENMRQAVLSIQDNSINPHTSKTFKDDVLTEMPSEIGQIDNPSIRAKTVMSLIGLFSNWITIQGALYPKLQPYIDWLQKLLENT